MSRTIDNVHPALRPFWHPVGLSADIGDAPSKVTLLGEDYVVLRLDGSLVVFPDRCPHRHAPLSAGCVEGTRLRCAYHGYRFAADGRCVRIPSQDESVPIPPKANLAPVDVTERYGLVWIAPEPPLADIAPCPEYDDPAFVAMSATLPDWNAGAAQMQDNFIDYAHFAYRHASTFGTEDEIDISADPEVRRDGWGFHASHFHVVKDPEDPDPARSPQARDFQLHFVAPFTLISRITYPSTGLVTTLFQALQPIDATTTRVHGHMLRNDLAALGITEVEIPPDFEDEIANEDRVLLEQYPSKAMPLDLTAEIHTKADKPLVEFRRILADAVDHHERCSAEAS